MKQKTKEPVMGGWAKCPKCGKMKARVLRCLNCERRDSPQLPTESTEKEKADA